MTLDCKVVKEMEFPAASGQIRIVHFEALRNLNRENRVRYLQGPKRGEYRLGGSHFSDPRLEKMCEIYDWLYPADAHDADDAWAREALRRTFAGKRRHFIQNDIYAGQILSKDSRDFCVAGGLWVNHVKTKRGQQHARISLFVHPDYQRKGVGSALLRTFEENSRREYASVYGRIPQIAEPFFRAHNYDITSTREEITASKKLGVPFSQPAKSF